VSVASLADLYAHLAGRPPAAARQSDWLRPGCGIGALRGRGRDLAADVCQEGVLSRDSACVSSSTASDFHAPCQSLTLDEERGITFALFRERALQMSAFHSRTAEWPTDVRWMPDLGEPLASARNHGTQTHVVGRSDAVWHVRIIPGRLEVSLAARTLGALDQAERELRARFPRSKPADSTGSSLIRFWCSGHYGAESTSRRVPVPEWPEIRLNYARGTVDGLDPLMDDWTPSATGRLLLWHGPPGTGKTYALRALAEVGVNGASRITSGPRGVLRAAAGLHARDAARPARGRFGSAGGASCGLA
jgi:hypothetical protein